jgi:Domain of unknown function (DUF4253)
MSEPVEALLKTVGIDIEPTLWFDSDQGPIYDLVVDGAGAHETWRKLREGGPALGCRPVLLGDEAMARELRARALYVTSLKTVAILNESRTLDPEDWFQDRYLDEVDEAERRAAEDRTYWREQLAYSGPFRGLPQGPWPDVPPAPTVSALVPTSADMHIALVPTLFDRQIPAFLRYGAYGSCPSAGEHVALLHYWEVRHGIALLGMAGHRVEVEVTKPPRTRDEALELAREHYLYCPDLLLAGSNTLQELAARLLDAPLWSFWWE